jgi:hypothetical protein
MNSESQDDSKKHSRILRGRFQDWTFLPHSVRKYNILDAAFASLK